MIPVPVVVVKNIRSATVDNISFSTLPFILMKFTNNGRPNRVPGWFYRTLMEDGKEFPFSWMTDPMRPSVTAFARRVIPKIKGLGNSFPDCFSLKCFLHRDRLNPFGLTAMEIKDSLLEDFHVIACAPPRAQAPESLADKDFSPLLKIFRSSRCYPSTHNIKDHLFLIYWNYNIFLRSPIITILSQISCGS